MFTRRRIIIFAITYAAVTTFFLVGSYFNTAEIRSWGNPENQTPPPAPDPEMIPWDTEPPMEWSDFQGPVDDQSPYDAMTADRLAYSYRYWPSGEGEECTFYFIEIITDAGINRSRSWVRPGAQSPSLLSHEQGHFHILAIHASRFNLEKTTLLGRTFPCGDDPAVTAEQLVRSIFDPIVAALDQMQRDYDADTGHGTNAQQQRDWENRILDQIIPLPPSGATPPIIY